MDEAPALRSPRERSLIGATSKRALDLRGGLGDDMSFQLGSGESDAPGSAGFMLETGSRLDSAGGERDLSEASSRGQVAGVIDSWLGR